MTGDLRRDADVIVVGGGLAGVIAARDLAKHGLRTVLVEARDRLGGRTAQAKLGDRMVDTGGAWFHWFQAAIWTEVQRYELELVERPHAQRYVMGTGRDLVSMSPEELDRRLRPALLKFWGDPLYVKAFTRPFSVRAQSAAARIDAISVDERLRTIKLDPVDDYVLRGVFTDFGRPLDRVSLGWVIQRAANAVWSYEAFNALFAVFRLKDGMQSLISKMVSDGGFDVRLSSAVTSIEQNAAGTTTHLEDGSFLNARAVVVATPVNVWKTIKFSPALPDVHQQASREGTATTLNSFMMRVKGLSEVINTFSPFGQERFDCLFTYEILGLDEQILAGFSANGGVSITSGRAGIRAALSRILPEARLIDFVGYDWASEPFSLGGTGTLQIGQLTRFLDVLDQPRGRLFFASADVSYQFAGFLSGAMEAGTRAAHRAAVYLSSPG